MNQQIMPAAVDVLLVTLANLAENMTMNKHTYGVNTLNSGYIDVSNTLLGAKQYATRNGFTEVYIRYNNGYHVDKVAIKTSGKWRKV